MSVRADGRPHTLDSATAGPQRSARIESLVVGAATMVLLAVRAPFAPGKLWAEDGAVFLQGALDHGLARPFLTAYQGYLHTVPRLIAAVAASVPLSMAAVTTWLLVLVVVGWCGATVYASSDGWLASRPLRVALAVSLVALPAMQFESLANAANLQFTLLFASLVVLIDRDARRGRSANSVVLVVATTLSSALAVVLVPVVLARWWSTRRRRPDRMAVAFGAAITLQSLVVLTAGGARQTHERTTVSDSLRSFGVVVARTFSPAVGPGPLRFLIVVAGIVVVVGLAVGSIRLVRRSADRLIGLALVGVPAVGLMMWIIECVSNGATYRYAIFPTLCLTWTILVMAEVLIAAAPSARRSRRGLGLLGVVVLTLALASARSWTPTAFRENGPSWRDELARAASGCRPGSVTAKVVIGPSLPPPSQWSVEIPCGRLGVDQP